MIAIVLSTIVLVAFSQVFEKTAQSAQLVTERSAMQEELRASMDQIMRDLDQAGAGMPFGGVPIPSSSAGGTNPGFTVPGTTNTFSLTQGTLFMVTPAADLGPTTSEGTDVIMLAYVDPNLNWLSVQVPAADIAANGTSITMPAGTSPAVNDPAVGIQVGDVMLVTNQNGSALGAVTSVSGSTINFANNGDTWKLNQTAPTVGNIQALKSGSPAVYPAGPPPATNAGTTVQRLLVVTYFIQQITLVDGTTDYQLMRQVNENTPVPVADHISDMQILYDLYNSGTESVTVLQPSVPQANATQIRKITVQLTERWPRKNSSAQYDYLYYSTAVAPRNLSFHDRYD